MTLDQYLESRYAAKTVKAYRYQIALFLEAVPYAFNASYRDVSAYLADQRAKGYAPANLNRILASVKVYYNWLYDTRQITAHPCQSLKLRDNRDRAVQKQDLFKPEEVETLLTRNERYGILELRNQVVVSLLIYQALTTGEITKLKASDLDLKMGKIQVAGSRNNAERSLYLRHNQIMLFHEYLTQIRPKLLEENPQGKHIRSLIVTKKGTAENGEGVHYLISTFQSLFNRPLNPTTIRQSVIHNLLRSHDLRTVQAFAGHRYPSTTEKYKPTDPALAEDIEKFHPLQ